MKKKIFILVLCFMFLITGCATITGNKSEKDKEIMLAKAEEFSKILKQNNLENSDMLSYFSGDVKKQLTEEYMRSAAYTYKNIVGDFQKQNSANVTEINKNMAVEIQTENEFRSAKETYLFNKSKALTGVFFKYGVIKPNEGEYYTESPIEIKGEEENIPGALVLPKNVEKPPIAILIAGSGPNDMDETIGKGGNKLLKDVALGLAKDGIASIRYDKISIHEKPKDMISVDWEYFITAKNAIEYAKNLESINKDEIYLIGHSQGAMMAPKIAIDNGNIKGIALMAGTLRGLEDVIAFQNKQYLDSNPEMSQKDKEKQLKNLDKALNSIKNVKKESNKTILGLPESYWLSLNNVKPQEAILKYDGKIIVLQGEMDFQVNSKIDFQSYKDTLKDNSEVEYKLYPKLNHLFMLADSNKMDITTYDKKGNVASEVVEDISNWIKK